MKFLSVSTNCQHSCSSRKRWQSSAAKWALPRSLLLRYILAGLANNALWSGDNGFIFMVWVSCFDMFPLSGGDLLRLSCNFTLTNRTFPINTGGFSRDRWIPSWGIHGPFSPNAVVFGRALRRIQSSFMRISGIMWFRWSQPIWFGLRTQPTAAIIWVTCFTGPLFPSS